jgi:hypothetical protein
MIFGELGDAIAARIVGQYKHYGSHRCPDIQTNRDSLEFRAKGTRERQRVRPVHGRH